MTEPEQMPASISIPVISHAIFQLCTEHATVKRLEDVLKNCVSAAEVKAMPSVSCRLMQPSIEIATRPDNVHDDFPCKAV